MTSAFPLHAAALGGNDTTTPPPQSSAGANIQLNTLEAGAGGTYTPTTGNQVPSLHTDPRNPASVPPPPDPEGKVCPNTITLHPGGRTIVSVATFYPSFTRNAQGGYDGYDAAFGYNQPNAIPANGDPSQQAIGDNATAANIGGHIIGVGAFLDQRGTWHDATPGIPPYGGSCQGFAFTYSTPYVAGDAAPPIPPPQVLDQPPFASGAALMAQLTGQWRIGTIDTLPGPQPNITTYVHIPTCAWLNSGVPTAPVPLHAIKTTTENGVTLYLVYNLTVSPGPITWDWGDGSSSQSGPVETAPASMPQYDPSAQTWTDPCDVSHHYPTVSAGVTITATQTFFISITVSWFDGVAVHTAPVACDAANEGPCQLTIGAANGWASGPHPVSQIEPVPVIASPEPTSAPGG